MPPTNAEKRTRFFAPSPRSQRLFVMPNTLDFGKPTDQTRWPEQYQLDQDLTPIRFETPPRLRGRLVALARQYESADIRGTGLRAKAVMVKLFI